MANVSSRVATPIPKKNGAKGKNATASAATSKTGPRISFFGDEKKNVDDDSPQGREERQILIVDKENMIAKDSQGRTVEMLETAL